MEQDLPSELLQVAQGGESDPGGAGAWMKLELFLCWCSPALWGVHSDFQRREGQKSRRAKTLQDPNPRHLLPVWGWWSSCSVAPRCPSLRATSPELQEGKLCSCFLLGEGPVWGLFVFCCWMWDFGDTFPDRALG